MADEPEPEIFEPEAPEPTVETTSNIRALRDAFAADPAPDEADDLVAETPVEPDWTSDDTDEAEVEAVFAAEADLEPAADSEVIAFADEPEAEFEPETEPEPEVEDDEVVADAASTTIYSPEPRSVPTPVAPAPAPAAPAAVAGDAIDQLVSILSSAASATPTPIRPVAVPESVAAAGTSFSANEVDAIRDTWRDMQDRYNIAAMPRLAQAVTTLLEALTNEQRAAAAAVIAAEQAANVVPVTPAEAPANAAGGRRFVRGLF